MERIHRRKRGRFFGAAAILLGFALLLGACTGGGAQKPAAPAPSGGGASAGAGAAGGGQAAAPGPAAKPPEKSKVVVAVGGQECICYLPLPLGVQLGYFKEEGIDLDVQNFSGGSKALEALLGGSADVVSGYYEHTIRMAAENKPIKMFAVFDRFPGLVLVVAPKAAGKVNSVKELKGLVVGVSSPGSATHYFLNFALTKAGLKPTDVSVTGIGLGATSVAAVERGQVDAAVLLDPAATILQQRGQVKILYDTRSEADTKAVFGGGYAAGGFYATADFLSKNPETARRIGRAVVKTLQWIQTHSAEEIAAKMPEQLQGPDKALYLAAVKASLPMFSPDGKMPEGAPKNTYEVLALSDERLRAAKVDLQSTYTDEFLK